MIRRHFATHFLIPPAACLLLLSTLVPAGRADEKLSEDDRVEILRGLLSEYATVKAFLPRSKKPLPFDASGAWNKEAWAQAGQEFGPAARVGDLVQITHLSIEPNQIILEINNGMKGKGTGSWRDHVQVGMGPTMSPINRQQNSNAPSGTSIALLFNGPVPSVKADEIKKILAPVLDFDAQSASDNYIEKLPEPIQKAIKANKVIVGMDRDQVLLAIGKPRHKERNVSNDGTETEDWIYGDPPGKITFLTFVGSKVTAIKEAYADIGGSTAPPLVAK
ncbi:MAG TPA: hypothetical protein VK708_15365 [Bryobacteraceae bacterium]|jgi:hypothetical protein|nr:hypothetical protein [Bryobacteraceae bacterium]